MRDDHHSLPPARRFTSAIPDSKLIRAFSHAIANFFFFLPPPSAAPEKSAASRAARSPSAAPPSFLRFFLPESPRSSLPSPSRAPPLRLPPPEARSGASRFATRSLGADGFGGGGAGAGAGGAGLGGEAPADGVGMAKAGLGFLSGLGGLGGLGRGAEADALIAFGGGGAYRHAPFRLWRARRRGCPQRSRAPSAACARPFASSRGGASSARSAACAAARRHAATSAATPRSGRWPRGAPTCPRPAGHGRPPQAHGSRSGRGRGARHLSWIKNSFRIKTFLNFF